MHENEINELRGVWDELNERILEKKNAEKAIKELREKAIQILDSIAETEADGELFLDTGEDDPAEDATCLPAKLPTEAEWRSSWIDWANKKPGIIFLDTGEDDPWEGKSAEELYEDLLFRNPLLPKGHFGTGKSALVERKWRNECDALIARRDELIKQNELEEQAIEELAEDEVENARLDK